MPLETIGRCILCGSGNTEAADAPNNIMKCLDCGHVYDDPRPSREDIFSFYSKFDKYDSWLSMEKQREGLWRRRLRLVSKYRKAGSLLDVGAGIGQFLRLARGAFEARGSEVSETAVRIAREKYGIALERGELQDISWGSKFDVITLFHVLEHVPFPRETISKCRELLNDGGIMVVAVPNDVECLKSRIKRALGLSKGYKIVPRIALESAGEVHLSHFTPRALADFLAGNGYRVMESTLDPYFVEKGARKVMHELFYWLCLAFMRVTGINIYDTIWIAAVKK